MHENVHCKDIIDECIVYTELIYLLVMHNSQAQNHFKCTRLHNWTKDSKEINSMCLAKAICH